MREIRTHIDIAASPQDVWTVLTNFGAYPQWNPYIKFVDGEAQPGQTLHVTIAPAGSRAAHLQSRVLGVTPQRELRWRSRRLLGGLFDQEQLFRVEPGPNGTTRFVNRQRFSGVLSLLFWQDVRERTRLGLELMNRALKIRTERGLPQ
jgi:hypothetical protein